MERTATRFSPQEILSQKLQKNPQEPQTHKNRMIKKANNLGQRDQAQHDAFFAEDEEDYRQDVLNNHFSEE